jgi:hypothetical protein
MSTTKPRITLTLEPEVYEVVRRLSAASGDSMSAVVADFLDVAVPQMQRVALVLEHAKAIPSQTKEELRHSLDRSEAKLLSAVAAVTEQADAMFERIAEVMNPAGAGPAAGEAGGALHRPGRTAASELVSGAAGASTPVSLTGGSGRVGKPVKPVKTAPAKGGRRGRL